MSIEKAITFLCNSLYFVINLPCELDFRRSLKSPLKYQRRKLQNILLTNRKTLFGIHYSFTNIKNINEYQRSVPVSVYEDYQSYVTLIKEGVKNVITKSPVSKLCLSSGTSSPSKLIPFNNKLKEEFQRGISVWLNNIVRNYPSILFGKSFWIISPIVKTDSADSKITVGFETDSNYFGSIRRWLIGKVMAIPDEISYLGDTENYYYAISYFLLKERNLRLISVWNPLVLINILKKILQYHSQIISDIENGRIGFPETIPDSIINLFRKFSAASPGDGSRLKQIFMNYDVGTPFSLISSKLWPELKLISCWTDSWASRFSSELKEYFAGVPIQGKGLLATEAIITIPLKLINCPDPIYLPAVNSHFLEFKRITDHQIFLIDQLEKGTRYEVIVTTSGGFYRYSLNDIVEVTGYYKNIPTLKFLGKSDLVCDITGEKLNEIHVAEVIDRIVKKFKLKSRIRFITPLVANGIPGYVLMVESIDFKAISTDWYEITRQLDELLSENYHYLNSRKLMQLNLPQIFIMNPGSEELYFKLKSARSVQGTTKICSLDYSHEWTNLLPGNFVN